MFLEKNLTHHEAWPGVQPTCALRRSVAHREQLVSNTIGLRHYCPQQEKNTRLDRMDRTTTAYQKQRVIEMPRAPPIGVVMPFLVAVNFEDLEVNFLMRCCRLRLEKTHNAHRK